MWDVTKPCRKGVLGQFGWQRGGELQSSQRVRVDVRSPPLYAGQRLRELGSGNTWQQPDRLLVDALAGIDHVGLGSDYDGIDHVPVGLEDVSRFPDLIAELLERGYSDHDIRKLAGENFLRVMREAEAVSERLRKERGPYVDTISPEIPPAEEATAP